MTISVGAYLAKHYVYMHDVLNLTKSATRQKWVRCVDKYFDKISVITECNLLGFLLYLSNTTAKNLFKLAIANVYVICTAITHAIYLYLYARLCN